MPLLQTTAAPNLKTADNWVIDQSPVALSQIHEEGINITIYEREIRGMHAEINTLLSRDVDVRASGTIAEILGEITQVIHPAAYRLILQDIKELLQHFAAVTEADKFRLMLATVNTNMCRKFHTDVNDVRMLCTYSGPGTVWLTDDNVDRSALSNCSHNACIAIDESRIRQAKTGAVVLLKGAIYPYGNTSAVVHRSPTIEESGKKRLLLRVDTNASANLWS